MNELLKIVIPALVAGLGDRFITGLDRLASSIIAELRRQIGCLGTPDEWNYAMVFSGDGTNGYIDLGAQNVPVVGTFRVSDDADFIAIRPVVVTYTSATGAIQATPSWLFDWKMSGGDQQAQNFPVHVSSMMGNGQESVPFSRGQKFRRTVSVSANFTNLTSTAGRVICAFLGYRRKTVENASAAAF